MPGSNDLSAKNPWYFSLALDPFPAPNGAYVKLERVKLVLKSFPLFFVSYSESAEISASDSRVHAKSA